MGIDFVLDLLSEVGEIRGKKALQKLVYLARAFDVDTGYTYRFHYYGPYSDALANDFEKLLDNRMVSLVPGSSFVYKIDKSKFQPFPSTDQRLKELLRYFGDKSPSELEIYATAYFIDKNEKYVFSNVDEQQIIEKIKAAKPKFPGSAIEQAYKQLKEWGLLYHIPEYENV